MVTISKAARVVIPKEIRDRRLAWTADGRLSSPLPRPLPLVSERAH